MERETLNLKCFYHTYPGFILYPVPWNLNVYAYNPELKQVIMIEDGLCYGGGEDNCEDYGMWWLVSIYKIEHEKEDFREYRCDCGECIFQDYVKLAW